jgi:predicted  nucleic acid-binding Zn-ribbon protein
LSKSDFYTPTDIDALRMENELLAFEVRFLRARLADPPENSVAHQLEIVERRLAEMEQRVVKAEQRKEQLRTQVNDLQVQRANLHAQKADLQGQLANLQAQSIVDRLFRRNRGN